MARIFYIFLLLTLILSACSPGERPPEALPLTAIATAPIVSASAPDIDQSPDGTSTEPVSKPEDCAYQWGYQAMPDVSSDFLQSIRALQPQAQANVFAFGENCVSSNGSTTFIAMETDFDVTLQVEDLSNAALLGDWIVQVMQVIETVPADQI